MKVEVLQVEVLVRDVVSDGFYALIGFELLDLIPYFLILPLLVLRKLLLDQVQTPHISISILSIFSFHNEQFREQLN